MSIPFREKSASQSIDDCDVIRFDGFIALQDPEAVLHVRDGLPYLPQRDESPCQHCSIPVRPPSEGEALRGLHPYLELARNATLCTPPFAFTVLLDLIIFGF